MVADNILVFLTCFLHKISLNLGGSNAQARTRLVSSLKSRRQAINLSGASVRFCLYIEDNNRNHTARMFDENKNKIRMIFEYIC